MAETRYTRIIISSSRPTAYYTEQETAQYSHLDIATIRQLQSEGFVQGVEVAGEGIRYSDQDIAILRRIRRLQEDLGINLEGVEVVLRLLADLQALREELGRNRRYQNIFANPNKSQGGDSNG
jgi:MerR family transcriptional regulator, heat shock protein HspR